MIDLRGSRFTDIMPENLASQLETQAFAYALGRQIEKLCAYADGVRIYADVDATPEKILDVLAVELRTLAYNENFSIEVKRELVKETIPFYTKLGTPAAVNQIIQTIFGDNDIQEWYEYGGEPHHFRIGLSLDHITLSLEDMEQLCRAVYLVKRLSSWLDEIVITICLPPSKIHAGGGAGAQTQIGVPPGTDGYDFKNNLPIGGTFGASPEIGVPPEPDASDFRAALHAGGIFAGRMDLPVPADSSQPTATTILRTGGVCTMISNLSKGD